MSYPWIRASEITEYVYCNRAWWLRQVRGWGAGNRRQIEAGSKHHKRHGDRLRQASWLRGLAYALLFLAVAFVVFQLLMNL